MSKPKTLLQLAGANLDPAKLNSACLVLIDMQNEYLQGPIGDWCSQRDLELGEGLNNVVYGDLDGPVGR